jgi:4-hydroxy-tetrahydrodipicolinate reductase
MSLKLGSPLRIALAGAGGRMGSQIREMARERGIAVPVAFSRPSNLWLRIDGREGAQAGGGLKLGAEVDVVVDFSSPQLTPFVLRSCVTEAIPVVIGTTGLDGHLEGVIRAAAEFIPIVQSANMAVGVALLHELVAAACRSARLSADNVQIHEVHHTGKKDAPSGTARELAETVKASLPGSGPCPAEPRVSWDRRGDEVGHHVVTLEWEGERLELSHRALDRRIFAAGALRAAEWVIRQRPGLYRMRDVLSEPPA